MGRLDELVTRHRLRPLGPDQAADAIRQLIRERGLNPAMQLLPHLSELVEPATDSNLQAVERAVADEALRLGNDNALAVLAARRGMFPG